jgi:hypothetical protein
MGHRKELKLSDAARMMVSFFLSVKVFREWLPDDWTGTLPEVRVAR